MIETEGMITVAEAAKRLNRSIEQVRRKLREGKLKGQRVGNQWFVEEASLEKPTMEARRFYAPEFIQRVHRLREEIARANPGHVFDVDEMLRESRESR